jgi:hypothetical protein
MAGGGWVGFMGFMLVGEGRVPGAGLIVGNVSGRS